MLNILIAFCIGLAITGCGGSRTYGSVESSTLTKPITLKDLSTGVKLDNKPTKKGQAKNVWTFFGEPRNPEFKTLKDGTIASISFRVGGWFDGYTLKNELVQKFQIDKKDFMFLCVEERKYINFTEKSIRVISEVCTATDGRQTLQIESERLDRPDPEIRNYPGLADSASITLMDKLLLKKMEDEEKADLINKINIEKNKAKKDL